MVDGSSAEKVSKSISTKIKFNIYPRDVQFLGRRFRDDVGVRVIILRPCLVDLVFDLKFLRVTEVKNWTLKQRETREEKTQVINRDLLRELFSNFDRSINVAVDRDRTDPTARIDNDRLIDSSKVFED